MLSQLARASSLVGEARAPAMKMAMMGRMEKCMILLVCWMSGVWWFSVLI